MKKYIFILIIISASIFLFINYNLRKDFERKTSEDILEGQLNFGEVNVKISRSGLEEIEGTFWQEKISRVEGKSVDDLYSEWPEKYSGIVYDVDSRRYLKLSPSNYIEMKLMTGEEFNWLLADKYYESVDATNTRLITEIEEIDLDHVGGPLKWMAIKKSNYHIFSEDDPELAGIKFSDGYVISCYIPIEIDLMLSFDMPLRSAGSEVDMCNYVSSMGIESVEKIDMTEEIAISIVKSLDEVVEYRERVPKNYVSIDKEGDERFFVHVYEFNENATATFNWYEVYKKDGSIVKMF